MTATTVPKELKKITQFVRRAEELDNDKAPQSRIVAYYCRQYAVQIGITLAKTPAAKVCLSELLGELEKEKVAMSNFTNKECYQVCRAFAIKIFDKADEEDRAGGAGKATARTFYAAATFLDLLKQFYDNGVEKSDETIEEEKKSFYSKWKATEILKAIKEGREPTPGGYGQGEDVEKEEEEESGMGTVVQGIESSVHQSPSLSEDMAQRHEIGTGDLSQEDSKDDRSSQEKRMVTTDANKQLQENAQGKDFGSGLLSCNTKEVVGKDLMEGSRDSPRPYTEEDITNKGSEVSQESVTQTFCREEDERKEERNSWVPPPPYPLSSPLLNTPASSSILQKSTSASQAPHQSSNFPTESSILLTPSPVSQHIQKENAPVVHRPPIELTPIIPPPTVEPPPALNVPSHPISSSFPNLASPTDNKKSKEPLKFTKEKISDATELTRLALKALEKKNGSLALERLREALECLD